jgi:hypothetical protein
MRLPNLKFSLLSRAAIIVVLYWTAPFVNAQTNYTWNNSTGNWSSGANWTPGPHVPNDAVNDDATVGGGDVSVDSTFDVHSFTFSGGTVDGAGKLTVHSQFSWSAGTMQGVGTIALASGSTMNVSGSTDRSLLRNIDNGGTINWSATAAHFNTGAGALLTNSGTLNFSSDSVIGFSTSPRMTISNSNLLEKSAGAGTTSLQAIVNNSGTILAHSGTLDLDAGGTSENLSNFNIDNNSTLSFSDGPYTMKTGTVINNSAGSHLIVNGALDADAATLTGARLEMDGAELKINGDLDTDQFTWNSGVLVGNGTTKLQNDITMSSVAWGVRAGRTLDTNGKNFNYTGNAIYRNLSLSTFGLTGAGTIDNSSLSTFTISTTTVLPATSTTVADLGINGDATQLIFNNSGTLNASTNLVRVWAQMNNDGNVNVNDGTVELLGGGTNTGTFTVDSSTTSSTLIFSGTSSHTLSSASHILGSGDVVFDADTDIDSTINSTGNLTAGDVATPTVNFLSNSSVTAHSLSINTASVGISGAMTVDSFTMGSSAGVVDVNNTNVHSTSTNINGGTLRINSAVTFHSGQYAQSSPAILFLNGGTLEATSAAINGGSVIGKGTIHSDVSMQGADMSPGDFNLPGDIEQLSVTGSLSADSNSEFDFKLDAHNKSSDVVSVGSDFNLDATDGTFITLEVLNSAELSAGDVYTIVTFDGTQSGFFNGFVGDDSDPSQVDAFDENGFVGTFQIHYLANSITVSEVPEPGLMAIIFGVGLLLPRFARRCHSGSRLAATVEMTSN